MMKFGLIGTGWRAEYYLRIAQSCLQHFAITGIVGHTPSKTAELAHRFNIPVYDSPEQLARQTQPDYVIISVARGQALAIIQSLTALGFPVLMETPAAETLPELHTIYALVQSGARIQVAEQYWAQPHHAARLNFARTGKLGAPTHAHISIAHGYHAVSLMRRFLNLTFEPVTITAASFTAPIIQGPTRAGLPAQESIVPSQQVIARFDFGDRLGIFDFTRDQYLSFIRAQRLLVRGERGEIVDETVTYLTDFATPIRLNFTRHIAGANGNLEGNYLKGIQVGEQWLYTNPFIPAPMSDEEIAIATCMLHMERFLTTGQPFYSLAEAAQDRYLDLLMEQSLATGLPVTSQPQPWHA